MRNQRGSMVCGAQCPAAGASQGWECVCKRVPSLSKKCTRMVSQPSSTAVKPALPYE